MLLVPSFINHLQPLLSKEGGTFDNSSTGQNKKNSALLYGRTELYKCFEISYLTFSTMALKA